MNKIQTLNSNFKIIEILTYDTWTLQFHPGHQCQHDMTQVWGYPCWILLPSFAYSCLILTAFFYYPFTYLPEQIIRLKKEKM